MFFLGKAFVIPYLLKGHCFLCVVEGEDDYCLFVPEENLVNECVDDLLLQSVLRTVNFFELVEPLYYFLLCWDMCLCKFCGAKLLLKLGFLQFKLVHLFQESVCSAFNEQIYHIVELRPNTSYLTLQFRKLVCFHSCLVCIDHLLSENLLFAVHIQQCKHLLAHIPFEIAFPFCFLGALRLSLAAIVVVLLAVLRGSANGYELFSALAAV